MTRNLMMVAMAASALGAQAAEKGTFGYDAEFVAKATKTIVLKRGDAQVLHMHARGYAMGVATDARGRVFVCDYDGDAVLVLGL
mgnify:CR=1 FL=1